MGPSAQVAANGDSLDALPVDQGTAPTQSEIYMVETLFKEKQTAFKKFLSGARRTVVVFIVVFLIQLPFVDRLLAKVVNTSETPYMLMLLKAFIAAFLTFVALNIHLVRG